MGDISLREMARSLPKNNEEFLNIKGVGQQKLNDFGSLFLETIKYYLNEKITNNNELLDSDKEEDSETDYHKRLKRIKENYANAYGHWKKEDDARLKILNSENKPVLEIARIFNASARSN